MEKELYAVRVKPTLKTSKECTDYLFDDYQQAIDFVMNYQDDSWYKPVGVDYYYYSHRDSAYKFGYRRTLDTIKELQARGEESGRKISEDEKITNAFVKITGLCVTIVFSLLVVGFVTVLYSLIKAIGSLF